MSNSVHVSASCIFTIFTSFLHSSCSDKHCSNTLSSIFQCLSSLGNVSSNFRSLVLQVVYQFLDSTHPALLLPKHGSIAKSLHKLFPSYKFSVETSLPCSYSPITFPVQAFSFQRLRTSNARFIFGSHSQNLREVLVSEFFAVNDVSNVKEITFSKPCFFCESLCFLLTKSLPYLERLSFTDTNTMSQDQNEFVFPSCLSKISRLNLNFRSHTSSHQSFNISALKNIRVLIVEGFTPPVLVGLSALTQLIQLELFGFMFCDEIHDDVRLQSAFFSVENSCLTTLLANKDNFLGCKLTIETSEEFPEVSWDFRSKISGIYFGANKSPTSLSTITTPSLCKLCLCEASNLTLDLNSFNLSLLTVRAFSSSNSLIISSVLNIFKLVCNDVSAFVLTSLLENSPVLKHLELESVTGISECLGFGTLSLKYVTFCKVTATNSFFIQAPSMPALKHLIVHRISDFDTRCINSKFPKLLKLEVNHSIPTHYFQQVNDSLENVSLIKSLNESMPPDCLTFLTRVHHLTIVSNCISLPVVFLPPNVKSVHCSVLYSSLCNCFSLLPKLQAVSGELYVSLRDSMTARRWLAALKKSRPTCFIGLSLVNISNINKTTSRMAQILRT
ncbi:hypothetical protein RCL1_006970 [Eukaryota sp. TZLM3-RCL]